MQCQKNNSNAKKKRETKLNTIKIKVASITESDFNQRDVKNKNLVCQSYFMMVFADQEIQTLIRIKSDLYLIWKNTKGDLTFRLSLFCKSCITSCCYMSQNLFRFLLTKTDYDLIWQCFLCACIPDPRPYWSATNLRATVITKS